MTSGPTFPSMNPWESRALAYEFSEVTVAGTEGSPQLSTQWRQSREPIIYPGLYSATGFDIMNILLQVAGRQNPTIELGPVDCSVALTLCDLELPDAPIVYATDSFCMMTGYSRMEILGNNCRFLQRPRQRRPMTTCAADKLAISRLKVAIQNREEIQLSLTNYKKDGQSFQNILTILPMRIGSDGHQYAVGFAVEYE